MLKDERRNLYQDVTGLWNQVVPQPGSYRSRQCSWWDFPGLTSWPQVHVPVRVIRSLEKYSIRRQSDQQEEPHSSDWIWVTTLLLAQVPVGRVVHLGHQRWDIENYAFNELANEWHSDHVFKHNPQAIECFLLVTFLAYNIFHAFLALNIKPAARLGKTQVFWAKLMAAELYSRGDFRQLVALRLFRTTGLGISARPKDLDVLLPRSLPNGAAAPFSLSKSHANGLRVHATTRNRLSCTKQA